jgi:hypothetical protein
MFSQEYSCPSCGGPVKQRNPGSKTLCCSFCGQTSHLFAESLQAAGTKHLLIDYGSVFEAGKTGKLGGREFLVLGRIRFDYEDGFWDEWYINYLDDGSEGWIQEDDGSFVLFREEKRLDQPLDFRRAKVGSWHNFDGAWEPAFLTSKGHATVNGGEGELPFQILPGETVDFIDGIWEGQLLSIELLKYDRILFVGQPFDWEELQLS